MKKSVQHRALDGAHWVRVIVAGMIMTTPGHADDASDSNADSQKIFSLSGFGTVGLTHSSLRTVDYTNNIFQAQGAGASSQYNFTDTTKIGTQINAQFTNQLSAVVQIISQETYNNSYMPTLEWANIKYAFTPDLSVRIGRIALPSFLSADYRNVGYANPWLHTPIETYNLLPVTNSDGVDASYKLHFGGVDNTVQMLYGSTSTNAPGPFKVTADNIFGVFDTVEKGALTVRAGYEQSKVTFGPFPVQALSFYNLGAIYDPGNWFVQGEWTRSKVGLLLPGYSAWYTMAGYRIQKFTPYVVYSKEVSLNGTTLFSNSDNGETDYSVGVRWDLYKNMDLKVQYDRVTTPANSAGSFSNLQTGYVFGSSANVISAVLDFVF